MIKQLFERINHLLEKNRFSGIGVALICFVLIFLFSLTTPYEIFELKLFDLRFGLKPSIEQWDRLTLVDIDEDSLTNIGVFPWPRYFYGEGLKVLKDADASHAAFDIMFPDSSPKQVDDKVLSSVQERMREGAPVYEDELNSMVLDNDGIFAQGIATMGRVAMAYAITNESVSFEMKKRLESLEYKEAIKVFEQRSSIPIPDSIKDAFPESRGNETLSISYPIPEFMTTGKIFGFVNRYTDIDGVIRKVRLYRAYKGRIYFNLSLVMLLDIVNVPLKNVEILPGKALVLKNAINPITHVKGDIRIPTDKNGMILVNWVGEGKWDSTFKHLPFFALIDYQDYAPAVNEFFTESENPSFKRELARLQKRVVLNNKKYKKSASTSERKNIWQDIVKTRSLIATLKMKQAVPIKDEISRLEAELKKGKEPSLQADLDRLQDDYNAISLVVEKIERDLAGQITLTGLTATGTHDIGVIPLSKEYPRVGTYHNTVNTILTEEYIKHVPVVVSYILMLLVACAMGFIIQRLNAVHSIITIVISFIGLNLGILGLFMLNLWVDQLGPSLALIFPAAVITSIKFMKEESQKKFIKSAFANYLAPDVIDEIIKNPESLKLGGDNMEITSFFSDVQGFSGISENLSPSQLVELLNEYLSEMTDIVLKHKGTIDKYEGDAIIAFFGAPHPIKDHAYSCCVATIEMKKKLWEMREVWKQKGKDELFVRMGMNTGNAVVGNMGSRDRKDYTAMGDTINLASRLEGANKFYKTFAMISHSTYEQVKDRLEARKLDIIRVVGKEEPVPIYELLGHKGQLPDRIYEMFEKYFKGLELFGQREWKEARKLFKQSLNIVEDDGPSLTYYDRCGEYIKNPPSKTWDGVYRLKGK